MGDDWDLVGGDPAPGQPTAVLQKASTFTSIATNAVRCRDDLIALREGNADFWQGEAASAFKSQIDRTSSLPDDLRKLSDSYLTAAGSLKHYGNRLESLQDQARRSLQAAQTASTDEQRSDARVGAYRSNKEAWEKEAGGQRSYQKKLRVLMRDPAYSDRSNPANANWAADIDRRYHSSRASEANADRNAGEQRTNEANESRTLADARQRLQDAKNQVQNVRTEREQLVQETVKGIERAANDGIKNKNWFQKHAFSLPDNWLDALDAISKTLDTIGLVLAGAAIIVAIVASGGALLPIVLGLAVAVAAAKLGADLILFTQGRRSLVDLGFSALDLVLTLTGLKALKGATALALEGFGSGGAKFVLKGTARLRTLSRLNKGTKGARALAFGAERLMKLPGRPFVSLARRGEKVLYKVLRAKPGRAVEGLPRWFTDVVNTPTGRRVVRRGLRAAPEVEKVIEDVGAEITGKAAEKAEKYVENNWRKHLPRLTPLYRPIPAWP